MFEVDSKCRIKITRGDKGFLTVTPRTQDTGEEYEMQAGDTLVLAVKRFYSDDECVIRKSLVGANTFIITPEDTAGLKVGEYKYDIKLITADGSPYTFICEKIFDVRPGVDVGE